MAPLIARWYVRCGTCLAISAIEEPPAQLQCGICGGQLESMGRVERDRLIHEHLAAICDERCTSARGPICNCKCGGRYHGSHLVVRVVRDAGPIPTVTPSTGREQARLNAAEYRRYQAALLALLDPLLASKRRGYLPTREYERMRELQRANGKAAAARDHRARIRTLRAVTGPLHAPAQNPIRDLADAIEGTPKLAEAPYALTATPAPTRTPTQKPLF